MKATSALILVAILSTGCAMSAKDIAEEIEDCEKYDLIPIVVVGGRVEIVKRIACTVKPDAGYTIIERGLSIPKLPSLPSLPGRP